MRIIPLYRLLAQTMDARQNCIASGNTEWRERHQARAEWLVKRYMPSGSGFDAGTRIVWPDQDGRTLKLTTSFHHMDEHGCYDGWSEHVVTVRPSLAYGFELSISGRDRNDIKEHIHETFHAALAQDVNADDVLTEADKASGY